MPSVAKVAPEIRIIREIPGCVWDKNGVIVDKLGAILAHVGAVWAHVWHRKNNKNPVFAIENRVFDESKPCAALTASIIRRSMP